MRCRWLVVVFLTIVGCDRSPPDDAGELARHVADQQRQIAAQQALHAVEVAVLQDDLRAAVLLWTGCGLALVLLIMLLARERRVRGVLVRVVHLLLARHRS